MIVTILSADSVYDLKSLEAYIHQRLGTPFSTVDDRKKLGAWIGSFTKKHPKANWRTMCRIVDWAKDHNKRPSRSYYIMYYAEDAWKAKRIPEIDEHPESDLRDRADEILQKELDPQWRSRLLYCSGSLLAQAVDEWHTEHTQRKKRSAPHTKQLTLGTTEGVSNDKGQGRRPVKRRPAGRASD
jgi:hypothetical protein